MKSRCQRRRADTPKASIGRGWGGGYPALQPTREFRERRKLAQLGPGRSPGQKPKLVISTLLNVVSRTFVLNYLVYFMTGLLKNSM